MKIIDGEALWQSLGCAHFSELSTLGALSDTTIRRLLQQGKVWQLDKSDVLFNAGDAVYSFYVVLRGKMAVYVCADGQHAFSRHHLLGEELGFVPMIGLHKRVGTAVATEDTVLLEISSDQFLELHLSDPEAFGLLLLNLSREMARAISQLSRTIVELSMQHHKGRY